MVFIQLFIHFSSGKWVFYPNCMLLVSIEISFILLRFYELFVCLAAFTDSHWIYSLSYYESGKVLEQAAQRGCPVPGGVQGQVG